MSKVLYTDLDETLISSVIERSDIRIFVRPGVDEFLKNLSRHGELVLLTHAERGHAENAMRALWPASRCFSRIISSEDMAPVIEQMGAIRETPGLSLRHFIELYDSIPPIEPPGVIFDDQPVDSHIYWIKTRVVGVGQKHWIQVEPDHSRKGLERAYAEYRRRFGAGRAVISGRARRLSRA